MSTVHSSDGHHRGTVGKIDYPVSVNGRVTVEQRWEARRPHEVLIVEPFSFPTFAAKCEAVSYLLA